ncbi:MAG: uroporphyrinogen decarboxylase [Crocinitomicaceae bacterium]|nr:uroporphyrinogen decarboxylase [Crocinitomicaceae bacterium]|tara:strand:+ start:4742 stop:5770 length:1029 start_codon:yes stop_codon:yes gene_type:complete
MKYQNDLILKAAWGEEVSRVPVWLMRQAGRILPEYREVRNSLSSFKELVETPELAAEVTIQPVDILNVDAAIIFSDILVIPDAMGLPYVMKKGIGPVFPKKIEEPSDIKNLRVANAQEDLHYVLEAIQITKKRLNGRVPIIGFAGAPWTIFSYMLEGSGSKTFSQARKFLYTESKLAHELLEKITESTIEYLKAQIDAGVEIVQVFDSWAGILPPDQYKEFGLKYLDAICNSITQVPITLFAKGAWYAYEELAQLSCNTIGVDWNTKPSLARELVGSGKTLQGNLDPCMLYSTDEDIIAATKNMLTSFGTHKYIANLGHGVYPDTNPEKVKLFIDTIKNYKF